MKYDQFGNEEPEQHYNHYRQYYNDDISPDVYSIANPCLIFNK